jgi:hypothetical protein
MGSAYGYGMSYYRDDLIYDAKKKYGRDYYYNSGLLYRDMAPALRWEVEANAKEQKIPMYNPGSAIAQPIYKIEYDGTFAKNSFIQITNYNTGTSTVIDLSDIPGACSIDTSSQTISTPDGSTYYGRFSGTMVQINPFESVIELPETFVENIEDSNLLEYDSFYIVNNVVSINPKVLRVNENMIGQYFCVNHNGGAEILSVNVEDNTLTLAGDKTEDINPAQVDKDTGVLIKPAGVAFNYIEVNNVKPMTGSQNEVCVVDDIWYIYKDYEWIETNLFSDKDEFKNIYGDYITQYKMFGATIVKLDDIRITTGTNINYNNNGVVSTGANIYPLALSAELQPRYL